MAMAPSVGGEGTWSDRETAEGKKLTAISVKIRIGGGFIVKIRTR